MLIYDAQAQSEQSRLLPGSPKQQAQPSLWSRVLSATDTLCCGKIVDDDVVSLGIKQLCVCFSCMMGLWLVSFVLIMLEILQHKAFTKGKLTLFIPMCAGSMIGILSIVVISVRVCRNATLISKERRLYMRQQGTETASLFIDYDSLPLMRRLFCWNISLCITFLLLLIAQVLFSLWFIYAYDLIGLWHALIPVMLLLCAYLCYLYTMAFMSVTGCWFSTIAALQLVMFVLKCNAQLEQWSWSLTLSPLYLVISALSAYTAHIVLQCMKNHYVLSAAQIIAMAGYLISLFTLALAVAITVRNEYSQNTILHPHESYDVDAPAAIGTLQYLLCTISVCMFTFSLIIVLNAEGRILAHSRGFRDPLPLSHTNQGWEPTHDSGDVYTMLLGTIEVALRSPAYISEYGANCDNLPPRSAVFHPQSVHNLAPHRSISSERRTEQDNRDWEGEIELLLRKTSPGVV